jgi:hypothetical protein
MPRTVTDVNREAALARKLGTKQILFWEADYLDDGRPKAEIFRALQALMEK